MSRQGLRLEVLVQPSLDSQLSTLNSQLYNTCAGAYTYEYPSTPTSLPGEKYLASLSRHALPQPLGASEASKNTVVTTQASKFTLGQDGNPVSSSRGEQ
eukprot:COSAG01_NODE_4053_length_5391_cov_293.922336_4_plen_99_part_00